MNEKSRPGTKARKIAGKLISFAVTLAVEVAIDSAVSEVATRK